PPPILRGGVLPYRPAGLAPRAPRTEPAVVPSYLNPLDEDSTAADLAATPEAPLDDEILAFAASLGHDYVRIYEHVRNEIACEWYAGSQKGAVGTLRAGSGNDVDQASLLIALFRASQLAARYVHGVVELPVEAVADDLGLTDPSEVPDALARAGVACTPVIRGGRVAAVQVEHTWVVAHLPYSNYRGAVVDSSGRTWLPLAPALATYDWTPSTGILRQMDLQVDAVLSDYLAAPQPIDLLSHLRDEVEAYLTQNSPGDSYEEQLGQRTVVRQELGLLPSSLPMAVVAITGEAPALADEMVMTARFVVRAGVEETSEVVLDGTVALSELTGRRVTLSYIPATVDDHQTVNAFGGLSGVPLYLVRVRPHLKINGRPEVVGTGSLEMGVAHRLEVELLGPFGSERVTPHLSPSGGTQTVVSGSYHALGFGVQGMPRQVPDEDDPADTEKLAAQLLSQIALSLNEQWSAAEDELAGLLDVAVLRPLPSVVMVSNAVAVDYAL
ncbi:MAG: hypothetical protein GY856_19595, partial [bacterium]|nr:hypothetical protein [bacterium]